MSLFFDKSLKKIIGILVEMMISKGHFEINWLLALNSISPIDVSEVGKNQKEAQSFRKLDVRKLSDFGNDDIVTTMK